MEQTEEEDEESEISVADFFSSWFSEIPSEENVTTEEEEIISQGI